MTNRNAKDGASDDSAETTPIKTADRASNLVRPERSTRIPRGTVAKAAAAVDAVGEHPYSRVADAERLAHFRCYGTDGGSVPGCQRQRGSQEHKGSQLVTTVTLAE